jgi:hypothetical protein
MTEDDHNKTTPTFLTPRHVAGELGISLTAVYALIQSGDLTALDVAPTSGKGDKRSYRIRRVWLDEFVSKRIIRPARLQPPPAGRRRRRGQPPVKDHLGL